MAEKQTREEKMSVIQKKLEDGVVEIFTSEKYREYMDAMSKFPRYSVNNCILIASQYPQASLVCGFRKWQKEFNRTVNKGEHGIMILAPIKGKTEVVEEVFDENNRAVLDEKGNQKTEIKENLDIIKQTADKISLSIEECVKKLKKDRDMYQMVSEDRLQYAEPNHKKR